MEKSQFLQTHLILPDVPEEAVRSIGLEDKKLLSINHTLFNQDTHKECVREKPGVLVIHYYFNEKIEVYHFNYQPFKSRAQGGMSGTQPLVRFVTQKLPGENPGTWVIV